MSEPTTALPAHGKATSSDDRPVLLGYLAYFRAVLARKAEGLTDVEAHRAACPPSDLTLIGLIRHMTDVERLWFRRSLMAEDAPPIYWASDHKDDGDEADLHAPPNATMADALAAYWAEIVESDARIAVKSMDDHCLGQEDPDDRMRRTVVHMIEEYARHCGHADLLRQAIDGRTGD